LFNATSSEELQKGSRFTRTHHEYQIEVLLRSVWKHGKCHHKIMLILLSYLNLTSILILMIIIF